MTFKIIGMALLLAGFSHQALANPTIKQALDHYQGQGAGPFSAEQGEQLWQSEHPSPKGGASRNCGLCHGQDLTQTGKHARTGKAIKAMAPSANPESLTELKKIEKWFKRNCKWTWGRECTAQEKGDMLQYLSNQ